ncbi:MAG: hypothetical protein JSR11_03730 [Bacteroidetes bacterium]|nr:hypothetical protein [Bacteroidota bacterium]
MRRFKLTSTGNFKGYAEALYDINGIIWRINFANCSDISKDALKWFKTAIPVCVENMEANFKNTPAVKVEEVDFEVTFDDFKREYPYKRNTHLAEAYWPKLTSSKQYSAFIAAITYRKYLAKPNNKWQTPMLPEKFLKEEQWRNDWKAL